MLALLTLWNDGFDNVWRQEQIRQDGGRAIMDFWGWCCRCTMSISAIWLGTSGPYGHSDVDVSGGGCCNWYLKRITLKSCPAFRCWCFRWGCGNFSGWSGIRCFSPGKGGEANARCSRRGWIQLSSSRPFVQSLLPPSLSPDTELCRNPELLVRESSSKN